MSKLHAILIGVSAYDTLGQPQPGATTRPFKATPLDGPVRTVAALADWLRTPGNILGAELGTLELLASPSEGEKALPTLGGCLPATTANVVSALWRWRAAAANSVDDYALFYFAGHGLERSSKDTVMLLQDFNTGGTLLQNALSLVEITGGMGSTNGFPKIASTQLYFGDCCRSIVPVLRGYATAPTAPVFNAEVDVVAVRSCPIFLAANGGSETFTQPGGYTFFGRDLLDCLNGAGADKIPVNGGPSAWVITAQTLSKAMVLLAADYNRQQQPQFQRRLASSLNGDDPVLRQLTNPPPVRCTINPATVFSKIYLRDPHTVFSGPTFEGLQRFNLPAGVYYLSGQLAVPPAGGPALLSEVPEIVMPPIYVRDYSPST